MNIQKKTDFFRIEMLALKILETKDCYGLEISQEIARQTNGLFSLREGSLYPVLYKLEDNGFISSYPKKTSVRQVKIYYHMERKGADHLRTLYDQYQKSIEAIHQLMEGDGK